MVIALDLSSKWFFVLVSIPILLMMLHNLSTAVLSFWF